MKTINIKNLIIQIDDDDSGRSPREQAQDAIDLINGVLQREPHGIAAQIMSSGLDDSDIEVNDNEEEGEDDLEEQCYHLPKDRIRSHRGFHCGKCGKRL